MFFFYSSGEAVINVLTLNETFELWPDLSETFEEWVGATSFDTLFTTATADEDFEFGNWDETLASPIPTTGVDSFTTATADEDFEFVNWDETLASPIPTTGVDSFTTATADEDFEFGNWDETVSPIVLAGTGVDETFDSDWSGI